MSERFWAILWASWLVGAVLVSPARAHKDIRPEDRIPLEPNDPMKAVSDKMKKAEQELSNSLTGNDAQTAQEEALQILDRLIDKAEKQKKPNSSQRPPDPQQAKEQPNKNDQKQREQQKQQEQKDKEQKDEEQKDKEQKEPQNQESDDPADQKRMRARGGSDGDQKDLDAAGREWGSMPPQLRQELIHSMHEDLPDRYKELLKSYYKKLSEMESE